MSNINDSIARTQPVSGSELPSATETKAAEKDQTRTGKAAPDEDVQGAPQAKSPGVITSPALTAPATEQEVLAALDKLAAKTPDVQKAVAEAAAALGALGMLTGNLFAANTLDGLVASVVNAARNNLGAPFSALYAELGKGLDELLAQQPENAPLKTAADSAKTIMDLLESGKAQENAESLAAALNQLAALAVTPEKATDAQKAVAALASTLHTVLSITSEAAALGDKLTELLARIGVQFPLLKYLPDAVAASGKMTSDAVLGLTMLIAAKVQQELAVLMETRDDDFRKVQESLNRRQDILRTLESDLERSSLLKESQAASAAVFGAFSQCGDAALQSLNALILARQVNATPRNPV